MYSISMKSTCPASNAIKVLARVFGSEDDYKIVYVSTSWDHCYNSDVSLLLNPKYTDNDGFSKSCNKVYADAKYFGFTTVRIFKVPEDTHPRTRIRVFSTGTFSDIYFKVRELACFAGAELVGVTMEYIPIPGCYQIGVVFEFDENDNEFLIKVAAELDDVFENTSTRLRYEITPSEQKVSENDEITD